uniref:Solute carrier family 25 member 35 n=1 Tax=Rhinolophus ferrumequinum TaxID=59479 RepID=A0A671EGK7_RHIFE
MDFLMSGLAACGACLFTNPLEVVKTRMQLQGELQSPGTYQRHYRNVFHAFITIAKVDGLAALQKGLAPALLYQFLMNGIRLGTYGLAEAGGYLNTAEGTLSLSRSAAAGALAGVMGAYLGSPIYMVKTHLQAQAASEIAVGHQYKHRGMFQALTEIGQKHGLVGLWRGAMGGLPRVVIGSSTQLCTFSSTKDLLTQWEIFPPQSWKGALTAAMVSGIVVVLAMTPFDVVSTRLYNQPTDVQGKVRECPGYGHAAKVVVEESRLLVQVGQAKRQPKEVINFFPMLSRPLQPTLRVSCTGGYWTLCCRLLGQRAFLACTRV